MDCHRCDGRGHLIAAQHAIGSRRVAHFALPIGDCGKRRGAGHTHAEGHRESHVQIGYADVVAVFDGDGQRISERRVEGRALRRTGNEHVAHARCHRLVHHDVGVARWRATGNQVNPTRCVFNARQHAGGGVGADRVAENEIAADVFVVNEGVVSLLQRYVTVSYDVETTVAVDIGDDHSAHVARRVVLNSGRK